jgi:hypothetical protein
LQEQNSKTAGEQELREKALAFFRSRREEWRDFVREGLDVGRTVPVLALAKYFMLKSNMPFDMSSYMRAQADRIRESLGDLEACDPVRRQLMVADWLRRNAQSHRDQIILDQARTLERLGDDVAPELAAMVSDILPPTPLR